MPLGARDADTKNKGCIFSSLLNAGSMGDKVLPARLGINEMYFMHESALHCYGGANSPESICTPIRHNAGRNVVGIRWLLRGSTFIQFMFVHNFRIGFFNF